MRSRLGRAAAVALATAGLTFSGAGVAEARGRRAPLTTTVHLTRATSYYTGAPGTPDEDRTHFFGYDGLVKRGRTYLGTFRLDCDVSGRDVPVPCVLTTALTRGGRRGSYQAVGGFTPNQAGFVGYSLRPGAGTGAFAGMRGSVITKSPPPAPVVPASVEVGLVGHYEGELFLTQTLLPA